MSQVSHGDGVARGEDSNESNNHEGNFWGQYGRTVFKACLALGIVLVSVLIILPAAILMLANIFPSYFPAKTAVNALDEFHSGVIEAVAWISLVVGVVSIVYAHRSGKTMDKQSQRQEAVLQSLQQETVEILRQLSVTNERMAMMSEKGGNLEYHPPSGPEAADEE